MIIMIISFLVIHLTQCNRTVSLGAFHTQIINPPTKIAAIGSGCSIATEPSAEISHFYNITQVAIHDIVAKNTSVCIVQLFAALHTLLEVLEPYHVVVIVQPRIVYLLAPNQLINSKPSCPPVDLNQTNLKHLW